MALDFPANPTNGQAYDAYVYNSTVGAWQAREDSRTVAVLSSTAPSSANPGDIWVNTNDGISFVYYDDGTSSQWIELLPSGVPLLNTKADLSGATFTGNVTAPRFISTQSTGTSPLQVSSTTVVSNLNADLLDGQHGSVYSPAGMISQFAGSSAPTGWLLCEGQAVSRTTFAALFSTIGTTYGSGDGSTTFNVPNLQNRVPVGKGPDTEFDALGEVGGAKTVTLDATQMPSHNHTGTTSSDGAHTHTFSGTTSTDGSHQHTTARGGTAAQLLTQTAAGDGSVANRWHLADGSSGGVGILGTLAAGSHTHTYSGTTSGASANHTHTFTTANTGGGLAHNNLQPYIVLNYIIKT
jgi:microcystin-dependent protein